MKDYSRTGADNHSPWVKLWSAACFGTVHSLKMVRAFLKKNWKNKKQKEYMTETICGSQSVMYLLFGPYTKTLLISALEYPETVHIGGFSHLIFLKNSYFLTFLGYGRLNMVIIFFTFFPLVCVSAYWLWVGSVTPIRHWGHVLSQCWDQTLRNWQAPLSVSWDTLSGRLKFPDRRHLYIWSEATWASRLAHICYSDHHQGSLVSITWNRRSS